MTSVGTPDAVPVSPTRRSHRGLILFLCIIVVVGLAEIGTRAIASHLPAPLQWDTFETQKKVAQMDELAKHGGAQIVYVGSSLVDLGTQPTTVDKMLGSGATSYNAALDSSIPRMTAVWTERFVVPKLHPKVIVLGLGSYDLGAEGGSSRTAFYNGFLASPGAKQALHKQDPIQTVNQWLSDHSKLWFYKGQLRDPETLVRAVLDQKQPTTLAEEEGIQVLPDGHQTTNQYQAFNDNPRVEISNWSLGTKDTKAVKQLIAWAAKRHILVVLLSMPVTNQFVDLMPKANESEGQFNQALFDIGLASHTPVLYFDTIRNTKYFSDDIHLDYTGSQYFSAKLGTALKPLISSALK
jgi:hypothetical protein